MMVNWELHERRLRRYWVEFWADVRFHGPRLWRYALRLAYRSPVGAYRVAAPVVRWVAYPEGADAARTVREVARTDGRGVSSIRDTMRDYRRWVAFRFAFVVAVVLALAGVVTYWQVWPRSWVDVAEWAVVAVALLGFVGRSDRGIADHPTAGQVPPRIRPTIIIDAVRNAGISRVTQAMKAAEREGRPLLEFETDPTIRPEGGVEVRFNMPGGVSARELYARRADLAVQLRRPRDAVWPFPMTEVHEGHVRLVILDEPERGEIQVRWPGLDRDRDYCIFTQPIKLGVNAAGDEVDLWPAYSSGLVGGIPKVGKSFTVRFIVVSMLEDDDVELHVYALRATGEFDSLRPLCATYRSGDQPSDLQALAADIRWLRGEIRRRAEVIEARPRHEAPESKVTPELADRRDLALHPIVVMVDEYQLANGTRWWEDIEDGLFEIVSLGPAVGVFTILATHKPDAGTMMTKLRDLFAWRVGLAVETQAHNDMILGQGMHAAGFRLTEFTKADRGKAMVKSEGLPETVRVYYADAVGLDAKVARLKERRRVRGGVLVGLAGGETAPEAGVVADTSIDTFLDNVLSAPVPWDTEGKARSEEIVEALKTLWPEEYHDLTPARLTNRLKNYGIPGSINVQRQGKNGRGHAKAALIEAAANLD